MHSIYCLTTFPRHKLLESYSKQVHTVFTQWDEDMQKMKDGEEKVLSMMKQHHKLFQQQRLVQTQKFKTMKQLHEQFVKVTKLTTTCTCIKSVHIHLVPVIIVYCITVRPSFRNSLQKGVGGKSIVFCTASLKGQDYTEGGAPLK